MMFAEFLKKIIWPLEQIDDSLPAKGRIYDLGCGEGIIAKHLARKKGERKVIGVDSDKDRLPKTSSKKLIFKTGDINTFNIKNADGVVISDVLHHIVLEKQKKILNNVYIHLKKNGVLTVKEIDKEEFVRSKLSRLWDWVHYPHDKISYWNSHDLKKFLTRLGFDVNIKRVSRLFPGSTTLFICKK